jgi:hypothetical protein
VIIRSSAVALVPLTLWFTASIVRHTDVGYAASLAWLRGPLTTILMVLLLIALFHHLALGLQVVCRFSFILALFTLQRDTFAQHVPKPRRQPRNPEVEKRSMAGSRISGPRAHLLRRS